MDPGGVHPHVARIHGVAVALLWEGASRLSLQLQEDWVPLLGQEIRIVRHGKEVRNGVVDAVMPDGSILWLAAEATTPRSMFERAAGYEAWIRYQWA